MVTQERKSTCPTCFLPVTFTEEDRKNNTVRAQEQAGFRKKDESFSIRFQATCTTCGKVYIEMVIKNVKMR
jgi:endogenous inhibitor of DNA gyrase (YacG/DUF329 family)